ncbi:DUF554 family protein [Geobacillus sp. E263]|uniref:DUF554 family protein n=1 Tax=Geobacillus sp. E263 TaxID=391290 RepID=UPI00117B1D25|nr:DUF554 family protein [Geobacillus sp. E263]
MVLLGTIVNGICIVVGSLLGKLFQHIPERLKATVMGGIALLATQIERWVPKEIVDSFITESTATGGILIMAIGLNMLGITNIRVANLLPSIIVTAFAVSVLHFF